MPTHYDYYSGIFDSLFSFITESAFLLSKGLLCLYDKQNNTWLLVDMEFLFSCLARHLTRSLRSLLRYRVKHSKRNSISTRAQGYYARMVNSLHGVHHHMTVAISLRLKVPVELNCEVSNLLRYFSRSISIEIDLLEVIMKIKHLKYQSFRKTMCI